ncbi:hypothetical protein C2W62_50820, partial [Candidatus Entotheonella serta]
MLESFTNLRKRLQAGMVGQEAVIESLLVGLLANGHILLEGVPGLAKTRIARMLATSFEGDFKRIQFTPDLLPSDLTGSAIYDQREHRFDFQKGPLFSNFVLADEINRSPAKVQSALLEAMEERQITSGLRRLVKDSSIVILRYLLSRGSVSRRWCCRSCVETGDTSKRGESLSMFTK